VVEHDTQPPPPPAYERYGWPGGDVSDDGTGEGSYGKTVLSPCYRITMVDHEVDAGIVASGSTIWARAWTAANTTALRSAIRGVAGQAGLGASVRTGPHSASDVRSWTLRSHVRTVQEILDRADISPTSSLPRQ